jgi:hypothetical protein
MATECAAVQSLKKALALKFPILAGTYKGIYGTERGKNSPRLQALAGDDNNPHHYGLALDIFLFATGVGFPTTVQEERLGDHLFKFFWDHQSRLGWTECIWKVSEMTNGKLPVPYKNGKDVAHKTHIHIDWAHYQNGKPVPNGRQGIAFPWYLVETLQGLQDKFQSASLESVPPTSWVHTNWLDEIVITG